jgi:hypothetical protein
MAPSSGGKNLFFYFALVLFLFSLYRIFRVARPFSLSCSTCLKELVNMRERQVINIVVALLIGH